jgi:hypothetical protein
MKRIIIPTLLILTGCATPQERCINTATRDMRVVDQLIAESMATLTRGYALESQTIYRTDFADCTPRATAEYPNPKPKMCMVEVPETVTKPKAVDLAAERAKLRGLEAKSAEQSTAAAQVIAQCRAQYPE